MPVVPSLDAPQVTPQNIPSVRQDAGAAARAASYAGRDAEAIGAGMQRAGAQFGAIAADMQANVNEAKIKEQDVALQNTLRAIQHDPNTGYLNQLGKSAIDNRQGALDAITSTAKGFDQSFDNDAQRRMWAQVSQQRIQAALGAVDEHAAQQTKVYNIGQTAARIDAQKPDMALNWNGNDPVQVKAYTTAKATMLAEIDHLAELKGMAPEEAQQLKRAKLTEAHVEALNQIMSTNRAADARLYFQKNLDEIDPNVQDNLRKELQVAGVKDDSLKLSLQLASAGDFAAQRKELKDMYDKGKVNAEVYDATEQRLEHQRAVAEAARAENERQSLGAAYDWLNKNPGSSPDNLPYGIYRNVTEHLPALRSFANSEGKTITNPAVYYGLRRMAAEEPEKFANVNLMASRAELSPSDWNQLVNVQSSINRNDAKAIQQEKSFHLALTSVDADMKAAGIDTTPKEGSQQAKDLAQFKTSLLQALDQAQQEKGRALTFEESRKVGLDQLKQGYLQGTGVFGLFQSKARKYQLTPDQAQHPFVTARYGDIPGATRTQIEASIRAKGREPSKDEVERIYQRALDAGVVK